MVCDKYNEMIETTTHYVGVTGNKYLMSEYSNHGKGGIYRGQKDLPKDEYPYTFYATKRRKWRCCELCSCDKTQPNGNS